METGAVAVEMASLRAADWLRAQVADLEVTWSQVTSALSQLQDQLQRCLLAAWPPVRLLQDLQIWFQEQEARLVREGETAAEAASAARLSCQVLSQD